MATSCPVSNSLKPGGSPVRPWRRPQAVAKSFAVKVGNRLYYPQAFLGMDREAVAAICRALGDLGASEKLMFWLREHGALAGKSVAAALDAGTALAKVERLAAACARERGASRVAAAA